MWHLNNEEPRGLSYAELPPARLLIRQVAISITALYDSSTKSGFLFHHTAFDRLAIMAYTKLGIAPFEQRSVLLRPDENSDGRRHSI
jgi:hypothetical protein